MIPEEENPQQKEIPTARTSQTSEARDLKSSEFEVSMNLFKAFIGIGVLSLGYGISKAGLIQANLLMLVGASFTYWSINLLITIVEKINLRINSFDQLSFLLLGSLGGWVTRFCVIILQIGTVVTYIYYFSIFFTNLFCYFRWEFACEEKWVSMCFVLILVLPLQFIRTLTKYCYFSLMANFFIVISLAILVGFLAWNGERGTEDYVWFDVSFFPAFFGVSLFSIESLSIVLEIRDSMKNPLRFRSIFMRQFIIIVLLYTILPTIFYLLLGEKINEIVIFNVPIEHYLGFTIQIIYGIALCLSYPLQMYPIFLMIEKKLRKIHFHHEYIDLSQDHENRVDLSKKTYRIHWISSRVVLCIFLVLLAYFIPDFIWFLNVIGALGSTVLGMILPVVLAEYYFIILGNYKQEYQGINRYGNLVTMFIGLFGGGLATYYSLDYMIGKP